MALISIISPCFNEVENIEACHAAVAVLFAPGGLHSVAELWRELP